MSRYKHLAAISLAAMLSLGLAACGGGGSDTDESQVMDPGPTDIERKAISDAIAMASAAAGLVTDASTDDDVAAADMAVAVAMQALNSATLISAGESTEFRQTLASISSVLAAAKNSRSMALALASQRMAISDAIADAESAVAAVNDDADDATVQAAGDAIAAATAAIGAANDISAAELRAEEARVAAIQQDLDAATASRQMAMDDAERDRLAAIAEEARRKEQLRGITDAIDAARTAVAAVNDDSSQDVVDDANAAVATAKMRIAGANLVADDVKATHTASIAEIEGNLATATASRTATMEADQQLSDERKAISDAIAAARAAVDAVMDDSSDDVVEAASDAISDARVKIAEQANVPDAEKAANNAVLTAIDALLDTAKDSRAMAMKAAQDAENAANAAMAATAAKLYAGIGTAPLTATGDGARSAGYSGTNDATITVTEDDAAPGDGTDVSAILKATQMTVASNHGWEGKQFMASGNDVDGTYEAFVYSNVGEPVKGKKFGNAETGTTYQYRLVNGIYTIDASTTADHAARVGGSSFVHTSGVEQYPFPTPNPSGVTKVSLPGTFHGVSGTYTCTPGDGQTCAASRTDRGFTLGLRSDGGVFAASDTAWTFKPSNPEARVSEVLDNDYASYGWWLHKGSDGTWSASAFVDYKSGGSPEAAGVTALQGTAKYSGGAAGKYALSSATGGINDAGHFTARATLDADFGNATALGTITGTIDQFMGADGESRDWMVKLNESALSDTGVIAGALAADGTLDSANSGPQKTVWTIGDMAADASGGWSGALRDTTATTADVSGVPKIATGTFFAEHGKAGRLVGAFGANKED